MMQQYGPGQGQAATAWALMTELKSDYTVKRIGMDIECDR